MKRRENWFRYPEDEQLEPDPDETPLSRWEWAAVGLLGVSLVVSIVAGVSLR